MDRALIRGHEPLLDLNLRRHSHQLEGRWRWLVCQKGTQSCVRLVIFWNRDKPQLPSPSISVFAFLERIMVNWHDPLTYLLSGRTQHLLRLVRGLNPF